MGHAAMISLQRGRAPDLPSHPPAIAPVTSWLVSMEALPSPASNPVPLIPPAILFGPSAWPLFKMQMGSTTGSVLICLLAVVLSCQSVLALMKSSAPQQRPALIGRRFQSDTDYLECRYRVKKKSN